MGENLCVVLRQTAILFLLMGTGVLMRHRKVFDEASIKRIADFVLLVVTPCLIVTSFQRPFDQSQLIGVCWSFGAAVFSHLLGILYSRIAVRDKEESARRTMRFATVFSNAGYMGLPLQYAILGEVGVFYGSVYVVVFHMLSWTYGIWEMRGGLNGESIAKMFFNPGLTGIAIGFPFFLFSAKLPSIIAEPVKMTGNLYTPLAMLVLGYYLGGAKFAPALKRRGSYVVFLMRHIAVPATVFTVLAFMPFLSREVTIAAIIPAAAPIGANITVFAARYGVDAEFPSALVAVSTILSIITLPLTVSFALAFFHG